MKEKFEQGAESRSHGKWIYDRPHHWQCSECGITVGVGIVVYDYCPGCGSYNGKLSVAEIYGDHTDEES